MTIFQMMEIRQLRLEKVAEKLGRTHKLWNAVNAILDNYYTDLEIRDFYMLNSTPKKQTIFK